MKVYSKPVTFSQPHKVHWPPLSPTRSPGTSSRVALSLLFRFCVVRLLHRTLRYQVSLFAEEDAATVEEYTDGSDEELNVDTTTAETVCSSLR